MPHTVPAGPPDYRGVAKHGMMPDTDHDQNARFNFLAHMARHLSTSLMPPIKDAFDHRVAPAFERREGRPFEHRREIRKALLEEPTFQWWSALRRNNMESRQQAGRWVTLSQGEALAARARKLTDEARNLTLDPEVALPHYLAAVDHHCMPGSYAQEIVPGDVSNPANYDAGIFAITGGELGPLNDGAGRAVVQWLKRELPEFQPARILDLGCGLGHNLLPLGEAFPQADVVGVDVAAPMLRYGAARAKSLGADNVAFVQEDASRLAKFADGSFDLVQSIMFLHETSHRALGAIFREAHRVLRPGGVMIHVEQPRYSPEMPLFEQAMRDWDAYYNNEPFWTTLHELDLEGLMADAGFARADMIVSAASAPPHAAMAVRGPGTAEEPEDYGRRAAWQVIGARKAGSA